MTIRRMTADQPRCTDCAGAIAANLQRCYPCAWRRGVSAVDGTPHNRNPHAVAPVDRPTIRRRRRDPARSAADVELTPTCVTETLGAGDPLAFAFGGGL